MTEHEQEQINLANQAGWGLVGWILGDSSSHLVGTSNQLMGVIPESKWRSHKPSTHDIRVVPSVEELQRGDWDGDMCTCNTCEGETQCLTPAKPAVT